MPAAYTADIRKLPRQYLPADFVLTDWPSIEPFFVELNSRELNSLAALEQWLLDQSEVEAAVSENACWRQIRMTCDTENKELEASFNDYYLNIQPHIQRYSDWLNRKMLDCPFLDQLDPARYFTYLRNIRKSIELFREENLSIQSEIAVLQQQYGQITGAMMVEVNGQEYTLQQAGKFLQSPDRALRETVYRKVQTRRLESKSELDALYNKLIALRNQEARQAGFNSYTEYRFKELGRFDYSAEDCFRFHEAVKQHVLPLVSAIHRRKKEKLGLDVLRPWDIDAEPAGIDPLKPFTDGNDLLQKTIDCFQRLRPFFADCLKRMQSLQHLDLDSRKGKAPGGYNCPLAESGAPFIFMNAAGQMSDVTTMVHEGGHAVHSFLAHPLELNGFKDYPMEIAEVASMSMELFSMDYWEAYIDDADALKRAKEHQLERVITIFPWIATIDAFQHWIYAHPHHTEAERTEAWMQTLEQFRDPEVDFGGLETYLANAWQRQLHLYEVPFYYIEYGIAQLGAIGMWMQYREHPQQALDRYCAALSLGGTKTLPELFAAAGLSFDFSPEKIKALMQFVGGEYQQTIN